VNKLRPSAGVNIGSTRAEYGRAQKTDDVQVNSSKSKGVKHWTESELSDFTPGVRANCTQLMAWMGAR